MAHRHPESDYVDGGGGGDIENDGRASNASSFSEAREPLLNLKSRINTTSQIAIVGAKVYPIESLDYDMILCYAQPIDDQSSSIDGNKKEGPNERERVEWIYLRQQEIAQ